MYKFSCELFAISMTWNINNVLTKPFDFSFTFSFHILLWFSFLGLLIIYFSFIFLWFLLLLIYQFTICQLIEILHKKNFMKKNTHLTNYRFIQISVDGLLLLLLLLSYDFWTLFSGLRLCLDVLDWIIIRKLMVSVNWSLLNIESLRTRADKIKFSFQNQPKKKTNKTETNQFYYLM